MTNNHLEQLIAEWYEFSGYFVRRNVHVGRRDKGGYECELDIVAFHPSLKKLVHIEPSLDADSWARREERYNKKFQAGRKYIPELFEGMSVPDTIEQIAVLAFASTSRHPTLGGGKLLHVSDVLREIVRGLEGTRIESGVVHEQFSLIRTIQFVSQYRQNIWDSPDVRSS